MKNANTQFYTKMYIETLERLSALLKFEDYIGFEYKLKKLKQEIEKL